MDLFLLFLKIGASIQKKGYQPCVEVATKLLMKRILFTIVGYFTCYIWNIVGPENDRVCLENNAPRTLVINEFSTSFFRLFFLFYSPSLSISQPTCDGGGQRCRSPGTCGSAASAQWWRPPWSRCCGCNEAWSSADLSWPIRGRH